MTGQNPYRSPKNQLDSAVESSAESPRHLLRSVGIVFLTAIGGGVLGVVVGALLGRFVPGYYRSVFARGDAPDFDPVAVGIGQGLTQGVGFGALVGCVLVGLHYWYRSRESRAATSD